MGVLRIQAIAAMMVLIVLPAVAQALAVSVDVKPQAQSGRGPLPPSPVIAEFPSAKLQTSLQAIEATFERVRAAEHAGKSILLSADSYEADGESYLSFEVVYKDGTFTFAKPVPDLASVASLSGFSQDRFTVRDDRRAIAILGGSPTELARFLDRVYRISFSIRLLPGKDSYNFGSEFMKDGELPPLWPLP